MRSWIAVCARGVVAGITGYPLAVVPEAAATFGLVLVIVVLDDALGNQARQPGPQKNEATLPARCRQPFIAKLGNHKFTSYILPRSALCPAAPPAP